MNNEEKTNLIKELIEKTTVPVSSISFTEEDIYKDKQNNQSKTGWFSVEVTEPHFFWGRDGEALLALNHLARRILENKALKSSSSAEVPTVEIVIDINNFQKKRIESVRAVAHMMAERARYFKSNIEIDPMSSFERRIVHEFLSEAGDLKTESVGDGNTRRVVIKYIGSEQGI